LQAWRTACFPCRCYFSVDFFHSELIPERFPRISEAIPAINPVATLSRESGFLLVRHFDGQRRHGSLSG
jgi:hypothetical protein